MKKVLDTYSSKNDINIKQIVAYKDNILEIEEYLFKSMGVVEADKKATMFYSIMFFYYSLYDGAKDKTRIKEQFEKSISGLIWGTY